MTSENVNGDTGNYPVCCPEPLLRIRDDAQNLVGLESVTELSKSESNKILDAAFVVMLHNCVTV